MEATTSLTATACATSASVSLGSLRSTSCARSPITLQSKPSSSQRSIEVSEIRRNVRLSHSISSSGSPFSSTRTAATLPCQPPMSSPKSGSLTSALTTTDSPTWKPEGRALNSRFRNRVDLIISDAFVPLFRRSKRLNRVSFILTVGRSRFSASTFILSAINPSFKSPRAFFTTQSPASAQRGMADGTRFGPATPSTKKYA